MKRCGHCKREQHLEDFPNRSDKPDGKSYWCKVCTGVKNAEYYAQKKQRVSKTCLDCDEVIQSSSEYCNRHARKGERNNRYKGFRIEKKNGYVYLYLPDHPNACADGRVTEHRFVMSELLGRPLLPNENVHHKNGIRDDNRPENLELWSRSQPSGQRVEDKVKWAIELLELYRPEVLNRDHLTR